MAIRNDQGIVLRTYPFGEADRVVVLLSPNHGKVRAVGKGVRKTKSRLGGRLEPFTHVDVVLYEGRNLDTISQATMIEGFPSIRQDLDRVTAAATLVEAADVVAQEAEPALRLFLLLQRSLRALDSGELHPDLVTAYLIQLAANEGLAPALDHCASCGKTSELMRFSFGGGGVVCETCRTPDSVRLREGVTAYLSRLATADIGRLPDYDTAFSGEAQGLARRFVEYHFERRLSSLAVLES